MPKIKLNFKLDAEERQLIAKADTMTREEIWEAL
jgi:hypothetical protein